MVLCPVAVWAVSEHNVTIAAEEPEYSSTGAAIPVAVTFANMHDYHKDVLLSYHILSKTGEPILMENQRLPMDVDASGCAHVQVVLDTLPPEVAKSEEFVMSFDLVDQKNSFWFSTEESVSLKTAQVSINAEKIPSGQGAKDLLSARKELLSGAKIELTATGERFPVIPLILCAACWISIIVAVLVWRKKKTVGSSAGGKNNQ